MLRAFKPVIDISFRSSSPFSPRLAAFGEGIFARYREGRANPYLGMSFIHRQEREGPESGTEIALNIQMILNSYANTENQFLIGKQHILRQLRQQLNNRAALIPVETRRQLLSRAERVVRLSPDSTRTGSRTQMIQAQASGPKKKDDAIGTLALLPLFSQRESLSTEQPGKGQPPSANPAQIPRLALAMPAAWAYGWPMLNLSSSYPLVEPVFSPSPLWPVNHASQQYGAANLLPATGVSKYVATLLTSPGQHSSELIYNLNLQQARELPPYSTQPVRTGEPAQQLAIPAVFRQWQHRHVRQIWQTQIWQQFTKYGGSTEQALLLAGILHGAKTRSTPGSPFGGARAALTPPWPDALRQEAQIRHRFYGGAQHPPQLVFNQAQYIARQQLSSMPQLSRPLFAARQHILALPTLRQQQVLLGQPLLQQIQEHAPGGRERQTIPIPGMPDGNLLPWEYMRVLPLVLPRLAVSALAESMLIKGIAWGPVATLSGVLPRPATPLPLTPALDLHLAELGAESAVQLWRQSWAAQQDSHSYYPLAPQQVLREQAEQAIRRGSSRALPEAKQLAALELLTANLPVSAPIRRQVIIELLKRYRQRGAIGPPKPITERIGFTLEHVLHTQPTLPALKGINKTVYDTIHKALSARQGFPTLRQLAQSAADTLPLPQREQTINRQLTAALWRPQGLSPTLAARAADLPGLAEAAGRRPKNKTSSRTLFSAFLRDNQIGSLSAQNEDSNLNEDNNFYDRNLPFTLLTRREHDIRSLTRTPQQRQYLPFSHANVRPASSPGGHIRQLSVKSWEGISQVDALPPNRRMAQVAARVLGPLSQPAGNIFKKTLLSYPLLRANVKEAGIYTPPLPGIPGQPLEHTAQGEAVTDMTAKPLRLARPPSPSIADTALETEAGRPVDNIVYLKRESITAAPTAPTESGRSYAWNDTGEYMGEEALAAQTINTGVIHTQVAAGSNAARESPDQPSLEPLVADVVEQLLSSPNIQQLSDKVYEAFERRLKFERRRFGL